jgi:hypothetical protein
MYHTNELHADWVEANDTAEDDGDSDVIEIDI